MSTREIHLDPVLLLHVGRGGGISHTRTLHVATLRHISDHEHLKLVYFEVLPPSKDAVWLHWFPKRTSKAAFKSARAVIERLVYYEVRFSKAENAMFRIK